MLNGVKSNVSWNFFLFFIFYAWIISFLHKLNWIAYKWHANVIDSIYDPGKLGTWVPRVGIWKRGSFHPMPNPILFREVSYLEKHSVPYWFSILSIFGFSKILSIISYPRNYIFGNFYIDFLILTILVLMTFIQSR